MKQKKTKKITDAMQQVASEILNDFIWCKNMEDVMNTVRKFEKVYNLQEDPFTRTPCTCKEYEKSREEYDKQLMFNKYGYYE